MIKPDSLFTALREFFVLAVGFELFEGAAFASEDFVHGGFAGDVFDFGAAQAVT